MSIIHENKDDSNINIRGQMAPFFLPGQVVELRAIGLRMGNSRQTESGYFDNIDSFVQAVESINGKYEGLYFTPNEINPALLARSVNKKTLWPKHTTQDTDIIRIKWLLIDIDPVRPSGVSSTNEEHDYAIEKARAVKTWLEAQGWSGKYILSDSGNGGHLLWAVDMPNERGNTEIRKNFLKLLDSKFSDEKAKIDTTVFNPARIWKIYGSKSCKGDSTADMPHRFAQVLEQGGDGFITEEQVSAVAGVMPEPETNRREINMVKEAGNGFDLRKFFETNGIENLREKTVDGGQGYVVSCPWNPDHRDAMVIQLSNGALKFSCFHASCADKKWQDYRRFYEPEAYSGGSSVNVNPELQKFLIKTKSGKLMVDCPGIGNHFAEKYHCFTSADRLYIYKDGVFSTQKAEDLPCEIQAFLGNFTSNKIISEIYSYILRKRKFKPNELNPEAKNLINVENGMLNWRTLELLPHSQKYLSAIRIPVKYNPEAKGEKVMRFLNSLFPEAPDNRALLEEIAGYALIPSTEMEKWFVLTGNGANGKSTYLNLLQKLIGEDNISNVSIHPLTGEDRFALSGLVGKLLNVCNDIDPTALKKTGELKSIVSGERLSAQEKGKPMFSFNPSARMIFSCNELPETADKSKAFWRRLIVIPFIQVFEGQKQKRRLIEKLTTPDELSFFLNVALAGLQRLMRREKFSENHDTRQALKAYRSDVDSVQAFINARCILEGYAVKPSLFEAYEVYCQNELKLTPLSRNKFYKHLEDGWDVNTVTSTAHRINGRNTYEGIRLLCNNEKILA